MDSISPVNKNQVVEVASTDGKQTEHIVTLYPVAMTIPNERCVYSLNRARSNKKLAWEEFVVRYKDYSKQIRVCFDESASELDILRKSKQVTAYSSGLDCWYITDDCCNKWL